MFYKRLVILHENNVISPNFFINILFSFSFDVLCRLSFLVLLKVDRKILVSVRPIKNFKIGDGES